MPRDAAGELVPGTYSHTCRVTDVAPDGPWAVHLADRAGDFHLIALDFDAKTENAAAHAADDAATVSTLLDTMAVDHLVCSSGPTGGRHIWIGLAQSISADVVSELAELLSSLHTSFDPSPLTNKATGAVRPPGAPHAAGGRSEPIRGRVDALTHPRSGPAHIRALVTRLRQKAGEATWATHSPVGDTSTAAVPHDAQGHPYVPVSRKHLTENTAAALDTQPEPDEDHSAHAFRCLLGVARAGWRHSHAQSLAETAPGLEHYRSARSPSQRRRRARRMPDDTADRLRRDWRRAVLTVAAGLTDQPARDDAPEFAAAAEAIAAHIDQLQTRADAAAGRWSQPGGPTDRRVLDALSVLALTAMTPEVDADMRRLALMAGIGRSTVSLALSRLSRDGWISAAAEGHGRNAARWSTDPHGRFHSAASKSWTQEESRPPHLSAPLSRRALLNRLTTRLETSAHDAFTLGALGHHAGNVYARLHEQPQTTSEALAENTGESTRATARALTRLEAHGLAQQNTRARTWRARAHSGRRFAAHRYQTTGRLTRRAARYEVERALWSWWCSEVEWLRKPRAEKKKLARRRPAAGQLSLDGLMTADALAPIYPRDDDGRPDHHAAHAYLTGRPITRGVEQRAAA